jgi:transposase
MAILSLKKEEGGHMKELYYHLLGLQDPWTVTDVKFDIKTHQVDIWVDYKYSSCPCPGCQVSCSIYDHVSERSWRHLDSCGYKTYVHAKIPRSKCSKHGILQIKIPWAHGHSRFTLMFQTLAINLLGQCTVSGAAKILRISWDQAWHIMNQAVSRGLSRKKQNKNRYIGVDEKSVMKGHKYFTIVYNLEKGTVEYISEDRKTDSLKAYFDLLSGEQKAFIEAVAMDMWDPYIKATTEALGNNKIVIDRFHVMKHMNKAVDDVRKQEAKELHIQGDRCLKGSKYMWLYGEENIPEHKRMDFEALKNKTLKVSKAWAIKEMLREFWNSVNIKSAIRYFLKWLEWTRDSGLKPLERSVNTILNHIDQILMYFKHKITNATSEGLNSKIQKVKAMACGFRNKENFKTAIYFHCGGLSLYP